MSQMPQVLAEAAETNKELVEAMAKKGSTTDKLNFRWTPKVRESQRLFQVSRSNSCRGGIECRTCAPSTKIRQKFLSLK